MKVILKKDVPKKGRKYDVINVKDGYVQNFLFPKNYAVFATTEAIVNLERSKE